MDGLHIYVPKYAILYCRDPLYQEVDQLTLAINNINSYVFIGHSSGNF